MVDIGWICIRLLREPGGAGGELQYILLSLVTHYESGHNRTLKIIKNALQVRLIVCLVSFSSQSGPNHHSIVCSCVKTN